MDVAEGICESQEQRAPMGNEFPSDDLVSGGRLARAIAGFIGLGLLLRLAFYFLNYPLWWDEAFVAVNLLRRDYLGLLRPLDFGQVCPLLFLWAELASTRLLGFSEWSLRLFPLLCAIGSMALFPLAAAQVVRGRALLLAVAIFAVSVHPIRHAADVKPYASDLLVALVLQFLAIRWWAQPSSPRRLLAASAFVPLALMLSHPSVFIVGGIGLAMVVPAWRTRKWDVRLAILAYWLVSVVVYALIFLLFTRPQASAATPGMAGMWVNSFPPLDSAVRFLRWLVVTHSGDMMAYPCGGERGASSLNLLACCVGIVRLIRERRWTILAILLLPLMLAMVAAALRLYPYGGPAPHGSSARIMQYAAPGFCLLIGLGASRLLDHLRSPVLRTRCLKVACSGFIAIGIVPLAGGVWRPYRAYHAESARTFAREFWPEVGRDAEVACLRWDCGVAEWDSIRLGIAVSLCNQAIYSPSRRGGGPRFSDVSAERPLRFVLGVAPETDGPALTAWLERTGRSLDLRSRESIRVEVTDPGRPRETERYEVFEFIPKPTSVPGRLTEIQSVKGL